MLCFILEAAGQTKASFRFGLNGETLYVLSVLRLLMKETE